MSISRSRQDLFTSFILKTSTLLALLGEMHHKLDSADSWFNLPRDGGIAYAAQESWVLNETIRVRYFDGALYACVLTTTHFNEPGQYLVRITL